MTVESGNARAHAVRDTLRHAEIPALAVKKPVQRKGGADRLQVD